MVVTWTAIEKKIWPLWNYCILLPFTFEAIVLPSSSCLTKKRTNPSSKFAIEVMMIPHINEKAQGNLDLVTRERRKILKTIFLVLFERLILVIHCESVNSKNLPLTLESIRVENNFNSKARKSSPAVAYLALRERGCEIFGKRHSNKMMKFLLIVYFNGTNSAVIRPFSFFSTV